MLIAWFLIGDWADGGGGGGDGGMVEVEAKATQRGAKREETKKLSVKEEPEVGGSPSKRWAGEETEEN